MSNSAPKKTVVIIGAGAGGIATAARLGKSGFDVTVLEKNSFSGGRCSLRYSSADKESKRFDEAKDSSHKANNGDLQYRFDQGPSLLLLKGIFTSTFHELGTSLEAEGVHLLKCEPNYNIWFGDGERVQMSTDLSVMKKEVEMREGKDGYERFLQFVQESHRHYEASCEHVLRKNFPSFFSLLRPSFLVHLLDLHVIESIWTRTCKYMYSERLRRVFTFASMYMGMSPFDAPGTYSLLQYTELAEGIWYPVGGFHKVMEALISISERFGVKYRFNTPVQSIILSEDGSYAKGVRLANGEVLNADIVINNSDLVYAYNELLPKTGYSKALLERPASCSSISFYWALSKKVPELETHNIFLADDYRESFDSIFKEHLIPDQPSFYVNVPSRIDPTAAPEGADSVVVLVPVGHLVGDAAKHPSGDAINGKPLAAKDSIQAASPKGQSGILPTADQDWPAMVALARRTIVATIKTRTGVDIDPLIVHETTNDPTTWQSLFNLDKGAILGLSHSFFNVLAFRPTTRARRAHWLDGKLGSGVAETIVQTVVDTGRGSSRNIKGLYMVGASAHPGTGVPIVLAGAALVAEQILEDLGRPVPWRRAEATQRKSSLDYINKPLWLEKPSSWVVIILALAFIPWVRMLTVVLELIF